jgi:signal peptidase II
MMEHVPRHWIASPSRCTFLGSMPTPKASVFWPVIVTLPTVDWATKQLAVRHLTPLVPYQVVGSLVRFTLTYNPGAAMSISLGSASRWGFSLLAITVLVILGKTYRATPPHDTVMALILGCVCGGAIGNLLDRVASARGVVDFIDMGIGSHRFYTFNVADMGVTLGVIALIGMSWQRESAPRTATAH